MRTYLRPQKATPEQVVTILEQCESVLISMGRNGYAKDARNTIDGLRHSYPPITILKVTIMCLKADGFLDQSKVFMLALELF